MEEERKDDINRAQLMFFSFECSILHVAAHHVLELNWMDRMDPKTSSWVKVACAIWHDGSLRALTICHSA